MPDLGNAVGAVLAIAALLTLAAGIYAVLRVNLRKATAQVWKEQAEAVEHRLATVEAAEKECKGQLEAMKAANALLVDRISGVEAVAALAAESRQQHGEVMAALWAIAGGRSPS